MTDPLDYWYGNSEVVERLTAFLSLRDVGRCCQLSRRWREALNVDHLWWRLAGRLEGGREMLTVVSPIRVESDLSPQCPWASNLALVRGVRRRWRRGGELTVTPALPHTSPSDRLTSYDCDGDLLVLGTEKASILCYNISSDSKVVASRAVLSHRVDKVYTRHGLVVALQGGLVQVFTSLLDILYYKSLELPGPDTSQETEDDFYVPQLPVEELRKTYRPSRPLNISQLDITISTTGSPQMWMARGGERKATCYSLQSGQPRQTLRLQEGDTIFKFGLVQQPEYSSYLYILVYDGQHRTVGTMYDTQLQNFLWRIELNNVFSYEHNVFSVYTTKGLLMFGRLQGDTDYPFTWAWRGWKYDGGEFYRCVSW